MGKFSGVVFITGEHGTGKTSMALEAEDPAKTYFIDDDLKGNATIRQVRADDVEFGKYVDFMTYAGRKKALEIHKAGLKLIDEIKPGDYDCLTWDTWTRFAATCHAYVVANPDEFRDPGAWAAMGKIRAGEEFKEARLYEASLIARLQSKVPLVILISHLKNQYRNNAPTGKQIPAVSKAVDRVCNLRLWVRHNPASPTPIGLVLKNIDRKVYDKKRKRLRTVQILPTKITPLPTEQSLWDAIERYYEAPVGLRALEPHEIPDDFENSIVMGTLTEDQRLSWLYAIKQEKDREEEELLEAMDKNRDEVMRMKEDGASFPQIAKELDLTIKEVVTISNMGS